MLHKEHGFTLLELMITLVIVGLVATMGFISMSGYLPKQRLITTARYLETILQRAQSEAFTRSSRTGVHFTYTNNVFTASLFLDKDNNYAQNGAPEGTLTQMNFRSNVVPLVSGLSTGSCASINGPTTACDCSTTACDCYVFFDNRGQAIDPTAGPNQGQPIDYEIFIHSKNLEPGENSDREIEVLSSGLVEVVKQGQSGNAAGALCVKGCPNECFASDY